MGRAERHEQKQIGVGKKWLTGTKEREDEIEGAKERKGEGEKMVTVNLFSAVSILLDLRELHF